MPDSLFLRGVEEFNRGSFFEAHELWEELWNETVGEEKRFYQGLIQIAAGYHKLSLAQYSGARKLLERGFQTLSEFSPDYANVDLVSFLSTLAMTLRRLVSRQNLTNDPLPQLQVRLSSH